MTTSNTQATPEIRVFSVASETPDAPALKPRSVGAAIVRVLAKRKLPLSEIVDGFAEAYLAENRNLPKSEEYAVNPGRYIDGYLHYLVAKGYIEKGTKPAK